MRFVAPDLFIIVVIGYVYTVYIYIYIYILLYLFIYELFMYIYTCVCLCLYVCMHISLKPKRCSEWFEVTLLRSYRVARVPQHCRNWPLHGPWVSPSRLLRAQAQAWTSKVPKIVDHIPQSWTISQHHGPYPKIMDHIPQSWTISQNHGPYPKIMSHISE